MTLNKLSFIEHTANCCAGCSDPADWTDRHELIWFAPYSHFCSFCAEQDGFKSYLE